VLFNSTIVCQRLRGLPLGCALIVGVNLKHVDSTSHRLDLQVAEVADLSRRIYQQMHPPITENNFQCSFCLLIVLWKLLQEVWPDSATTLFPVWLSHVCTNHTLSLFSLTVVDQISMQASLFSPSSVTSPRVRSAASDPVRLQESIQSAMRNIVQYQPMKQPVPTEPASVADKIWQQWETAIRRGGASDGPASFILNNKRGAVSYLTAEALKDDTSTAKINPTAGMPSVPVRPARDPSLIRSRSMPNSQSTRTPHPGPSTPKNTSVVLGRGGGGPSTQMPPPPPRRTKKKLQRSVSMEEQRRGEWAENHRERQVRFQESQVHEASGAAPEGEKPGQAEYDYATHGSPPPEPLDREIDPSRLSPCSLRHYQKVLHRHL
jgi:hypothetical protein